MNKNERVQALNILTVLLEQNASLSQLMPANTDISPLTKEICFGVCRHYFRLEAIALCLLQKKPKEKTIWVALLIGLYQLHYMHIPDYAVVQETVALLEKIKKTWAKGLINAVLRNFCRQHEEIIKKLEQDTMFVYGHPQWLLQRLQKDWPEHWEAIIGANDTHPPMNLRVNLNKSTLAHYLQLLEQAGLEAQAQPFSATGITLDKACAVNQLPGFAEGFVSVQDHAAQLAANLLTLKPGLRVLDACCAPGGKTCHILETEPALAACIAVDVDPKRLNRVEENLTRLNLHATLVQGDAANPISWWDGQHFDRILLDAPCSATGVIRRHSDIKLLRTTEDIKAITKIQQTLLHSLWPLLAKGGLLVYATCSIIPAENEAQIAQFVATHANCRALKIPYNFGQTTGHGLQILPGEQGMDGFFYSVLCKKND